LKNDHDGRGKTPVFCKIIYGSENIWKEQTPQADNAF
jgi:hypothetical protein